MAPKVKLGPEKDASLLKAVVQASGGVKSGVAFWAEVASAMEDNINGEAARKRFDKFKPGAASKGSKLNSEKDADLLKAVIKVNGGVGKGKPFWETVAAAMVCLFYCLHFSSNRNTEPRGKLL